jgi:hypothetical protein
MAMHLTITVDIDAPSVENVLEHGAMALRSGTMTPDDLVKWLSDELIRFMTPKAGPICQ